ncbi:hypothetical protein D3C80_1944950 [compost metagenome]
MQRAFFELRIILIQRSLSNDEYHIQPAGNFRLMMADNLLYQPSHAVSHDSISDLLADRHTKPEPFHFSFAEPVHHKLMIRK